MHGRIFSRPWGKRKLEERPRPHATAAKGSYSTPGQARNLSCKGWSWKGGDEVGQEQWQEGLGRLRGVRGRWWWRNARLHWGRRHWQTEIHGRRNDLDFVDGHLEKRGGITDHRVQAKLSHEVHELGPTLFRRNGSAVRLVGKMCIDV